MCDASECRRMRLKSKPRRCVHALGEETMEWQRKSQKYIENAIGIVAFFSSFVYVCTMRISEIQLSYCFATYNSRSENKQKEHPRQICAMYAQCTQKIIGQLLRRIRCQHCQQAAINILVYTNIFYS